jgi:ABC-type sugar transport system substrate-binding protein
MKTSPFLQVLLALGLLAVAAGLTFRSCRGPKIDLDPYLALASVAAEEAAGMIGGKGTLVLVIPDTGSDRDPVQDAQVNAFRKALKARGGVQVSAVEPVRLNPFQSMQTGGAIPSDQYLALRKKHATASGIVLFISFPPLSDEEVESLGKSSTKVMVVSAELPSYRGFIKSGAIDLAVVPRQTPAESSGTKAASVRESFDRENEILRR